MGSLTTQVTHTVRVKIQPICKMCAPHFDKKCTALLWFAPGFVRKAVLRCFLPNAPQFGETCHIFTGKVPQSLDCQGLRRFTRWHIFRNSVKVRRIVRRSNQCRCGMFVAFFDTYRTYVQYRPLKSLRTAPNRKRTSTPPRVYLDRTTSGTLTAPRAVPQPHRERTSTAPQAYLDRTMSVPRPHHESTSTTPRGLKYMCGREDQRGPWHRPGTCPDLQYSSVSG